MNGASNGAAPASYSNGGAKHTLPAGEQSFTLSTEQYRAEHGLVVQGDRVPPPLQTFESVGFASVIMDEVLHSASSRRCARALARAWLPSPLRARSDGGAASALAA